MKINNKCFANLAGGKSMANIWWVENRTLIRKNPIGGNRSTNSIFQEKLYIVKEYQTKVVCRCWPSQMHLWELTTFNICCIFRV